MRRTITLLVAALAIASSHVGISHGALLYRDYEPEMVFSLVGRMLATEFTVGSQPLTVTRLGVWSTGPYTYTDWKVAIWQVSNELEPEELVKADIPLTSDHWVYSDDPNSAWLFASVVPTTLLPNTTYRIGAAPDDESTVTYLAYPYGGTFSVGSGIASVTPGSFQLPWWEEEGLRYPTEWSPNPMLIANADFLAPVPEPSSWLLLAIGLTGVWFSRRARSERSPSHSAGWIPCKGWVMFRSQGET
jgi:hypothetical protein